MNGTMAETQFKVGDRVKTPDQCYGTVTAVKGGMVNVEYDDLNKGRASFWHGALKKGK